MNTFSLGDRDWQACSVQSLRCHAGFTDAARPRMPAVISHPGDEHSTPCSCSYVLPALSSAMLPELWCFVCCMAFNNHLSFAVWREPLQLMVFTLSKTKQANKQKQFSKQRWQQWQSLGIHSCLEGNLMVSYIMSIEQSKSCALTSRTFDLSIFDMWPGVKGHVLAFLTCSVMKCFQKTHYKTEKYMGISSILVSKLLWFYQIYLKFFK